MAIIVEDGTGMATAETYLTVAEFKAYHNKRGRAVDMDALDTAASEAALRLATDYMQQVYQDRWLGVRLTYGQALDWPRAYANRSESNAVQGADSSVFWWNENEVPTPVKNACAELAYRATESDDGLMPDLARKEKSVKVGPIAVDYEEGAGRESPEYTAVDAMLMRLLYTDDGISGNAVMG